LRAPLEEVLRSHFRLTEFRKGQEQILQSVTAGRDTMAVMPTGGGKSLCYQLPAFALGRLVIVISPLIALMKDQVRGLRELGLPAGALHSGQSLEEKRQVFAAIRAGGPYLLYLSPERVQKPGFADWIRTQDVGLFAIDEAHCVSQWGPDFRPDYHKLHLLRELKPEVPILALTATATPQVLDDVVRSLGLRSPERHVRGFYRPNLFYQVAVCEHEDQKVEIVKSAIRRVPEGRVLIYCGTRQGTETLAQELSLSFDGVGFYHAGLESEERSAIQRQVEEGELRILCATNAFGMGIDYPDVRLVTHFQMPANIESFYQEMGRAGRDGKMSRCLLLYSKRDRGLQSFFIQQSKAEARVISSKWRALDAMVLFAEGGECRHAGILTYFRDSERIRRCGHCDICSPMSELVVPIEEFRPKVVTRVKKKKPSSDRSERLESPEAELRAEVLREWRKRYADENDIPAFIVFSNRSLIDLANRNPSSRDELQRVYGFGEAKVGGIGDEVLKVLRSCD
jgi:ATP-dependent DNA helicase RecQ